MVEPKVLIVSHLYPSVIDPTNGSFIHNEVRALLHAGIDARVVAPVPWAPILARFRKKWNMYAQIRNSGPFDDVPVDRINIFVAPRPFHVMGGVTLALRLYFYFREIRRRFPFNIIHSHTLTPDGWACCLVAKHFNVPTVCTIRGSDLNEYPHSSHVLMHATQYVLRRTNALIATSKALSDEAVRMTKSAVHPVPIYKGVDSSHFFIGGNKKAIRLRLGLPVDGRYFVFVGRCEKDKGLVELFDAYYAIRKEKPSTRILIVGDGGYLKTLIKQTEESGESESVFFTGRVDPAEVRDYLKASDVFVLPTYDEGMPNALLEAMACGLPSIASSVGGIPEVLEHEISGLLIPPRDEKSLESAMRRLLEYPNFAEKLGKIAGMRIRQHLSWEANAHQNVEIYRKVLEDWMRNQSQKNL